MVNHSPKTFVIVSKRIATPLVDGVLIKVDELRRISWDNLFVARERKNWSESESRILVLTFLARVQNKCLMFVLIILPRV
jgi:hypothetical protein